MINAFLERIEALGYKTKIGDNGSVFITFECCPQWRFHLVSIDDDKYIPYFYYRNKRTEEVTDLHEIIPTVFSALTKIMCGSSFRFLGEAHEFSGVEDELYGMFWFPAQPLNEKVRKNSQMDFEILMGVLTGLYLFHIHQGNILGADDSGVEDFSFNSPGLNGWVDKITTFIGEGESFVANERVNPTWYYFRSYTAACSIVHSPHIASFLKEIATKNGPEYALDGVDSKVEIYKDIRTTIPFEEEKFAVELLNCLGDFSEMKIIAQENQLVFITDDHVLLKYCNCGMESVMAEKELIRVRQQRELSLLFGDRKFTWNIADRKASSEFEDLILELLDREPDMITVKKVAPTNEPDNGRDLICEYDMNHDERKVSNGQSSLKKGNMIVQCKTNLNSSSRKSIGKSDVDLFNTIYDYRPDGYMLVVNTQITRNLTEMLEHLKDRNELDTIRWWNAFDVEDRLRKHPDIQVRYRHLVDYE
ncbi:hypothetical protein WKG88_16685 [Pantoea agglomerans]|uniref:hypothetical protein n=1 Tax=Enterobacter agglomerans TaxID=549 RepID=UPI003C7AE408